jgi:hypothetical protein
MASILVLTQGFGDGFDTVGFIREARVFGRFGSQVGYEEFSRTQRAILDGC